MSRLLTKEEGSQAINISAEHISAFSVGFTRITGKDHEEDAEVAGSGTLVQANGCYAILTAAHVLDYLATSTKVGLVLLMRGESVVHRYILPMQFVRLEYVARASKTAKGPDLGLLVLPSSEAKKIEATKASKVFYNIDRRRDQMLLTPRALDLGGWFLCGSVGDWTTDLPTEHPYTRVKGIRALCGAGCVSLERVDNEFDYLNFEVNYDEGYGGPQDFRGFSGGGLWQAVFKDNGGHIVLEDMLLSGVAFYQLEMENGKTLICHGRKSIYANALSKLLTT